MEFKLEDYSVGKLLEVNIDFLGWEKADLSIGRRYEVVELKESGVREGRLLSIFVRDDSGRVREYHPGYL